MSNCTRSVCNGTVLRYVNRISRVALRDQSCECDCRGSEQLALKLMG